MSSRTASGGARRKGSPFFVAHLAGNDLALLRAAQTLELGSTVSAAEPAA